MNKDSYLIIVNNTWTINKFTEECRRVLIKALPTNAGKAWMMINGTAVIGLCYPIDPGESISFPLTRLDMLDFVFEDAADTCVLIYSNSDILP